MKIEQLIETLKTLKPDGWEITDSETEGWEFYLIRGKLDQHRAKNVRHTNVKLYMRSEDGQFLGSASGEITPTAEQDEALRFLRNLQLSASFVKNPVYTLVQPAALGNLPECPALDTMAKDFLETLRDVPQTETEDINSAEIFARRVTRRLVTSEGIDVTYTAPDSMVEVVVNARKPGQEIELYRLFNSGSCDRQELTRAITEAMAIGRDKLLAAPTPAIGKTDVVFSTDACVSIYEYFMYRLSAGMKFRGLSDCEIGQPVLPGSKGDRMTLTCVPSLPNSSRNAPCDEEGSPIREKALIRDGIAESYCGGRQFSQYLGLTDSFTPGNLTVSGGTHSEEEIRSGTYLEVVEFSDFQVDTVGGDIAGEIRLGYWHDGDKVIPVSGGSVSGKMKDIAQNMQMSMARRQYNNWLVPALTRLYDVTVTGA